MPARAVLKDVAWRVAPEAMADRARDYGRGLRLRVGLTALAEHFVTAHGDRVQRGPVAGLRLVVSHLGDIDAPIAKLLGTYEEEIHPAIQRAIEACPARFIDLGSADGYFAAGIALAAQIPVDAFDLAPSARALTNDTAILNDVGHLVTTHGAATTRAISRLPLNEAFVLCDVDGPERNLFTSALVGLLDTASVIVEMHRNVHADVEHVLLKRFEPTHCISVVEAVRRDPTNYPELNVFADDDDRDHAVNELRYRFDGLRWLIATPR